MTAALRSTGGAGSPRRVIVRILAEKGDQHPDAMDIFRRAVKEDSRISLPTVYRTLADKATWMDDDGLPERVEQAPDGRVGGICLGHDEGLPPRDELGDDFKISSLEVKNVINTSPTIAVVDPTGRVVGTRAGEGVYEAVQPVIAGLVAEFDAQDTISREPLVTALEADAAERADVPTLLERLAAAEAEQDQVDADLAAAEDARKRRDWAAVHAPLARVAKVLRLMLEGLTNREIAERLFLSLSTIKWYSKQIYAKLDVHSRQQAIHQTVIEVQAPGLHLSPAFRQDARQVVGQPSAGDVRQTAQPRILEDAPERGQVEDVAMPVQRSQPRRQTGQEASDYRGVGLHAAGPQLQARVNAKPRVQRGQRVQQQLIDDKVIES